MPKKKITKVTTKRAMNQKQFAMVRNEMLTITREALNRMLTTQTDVDTACKYLLNITIQDYRTMFDRLGLARRAVEIWPDECWQMSPNVYEHKDPKLTDFEKAWNDLQTEFAMCSLLHRADVLSGIGAFGIVLLGINDGKQLHEPVAGVSEVTGKIEPNKDRELLYLRTFDESVLTIDALEDNVANPRYGKPRIYSIQYQEPGGKVSKITTTKVHWSRVIHIADNRESSETYGTSRLQSIYNNLSDIKKVSGGSAEMFWKGGFPGYLFELSPEAIQLGAELDVDSIKEQLKLYFDGLQRYLGLQGGVTGKSLSPQVADPVGHVDIQLKLIALSLGVPYRLLLGTEEAKLASVQDKRTWNSRVARRQINYLTPMVVRPFVDRLVGLGVLPTPEQYVVDWPDLNATTDDDIAKVALNRTDAFAKYVQGDVHMLMSPREYLTVVHKMTEAEADAVLKEAEKFERQMEPEPEPSPEPKPIPRQTKAAKTGP
jgi:hypothetical protein